MNKSRNNYVILENYNENNNKCPIGYHFHPEHPKAEKNGCMKDTDMKEKFGAFSIGAALKTPIRYDNENIDNPNYIGVD
jgi:hypothetical protein